MVVQAGKPISAELRDAAGRVLDTLKIDPGQDTHALFAQAACRLGGVLFQAPADKPADGTVEWKVLRPAAPNESEDLRRICSQPDIPAGFEPSQELSVAVQIFEQSLTSAKWRAWIHRLKAELGGASEPAAATSTRQKFATDLAPAASAAGLTDCWFAARLR